MMVTRPPTWTGNVVVTLRPAELALAWRVIVPLRIDEKLAVERAALLDQLQVEPGFEGLATSLRPEDYRKAREHPGRSRNRGELDQTFR